MITPAVPDPPDGFDAYRFESPDPIPGVRSSIPMYVTGPSSRPGVILMHEAGGMSPLVIQLARELTDEADGSGGFRVHLPLLFGKPNQETSFGIDVKGVLCMRKEMHYLASRRTSPITGLIRQLVVEVARQTGIGKVGVIGMCITGNLVFGLMAESLVHAAVTSQPSLPFPILYKLTPRYTRAALGVGTADLIEGVRSGTRLLALRFQRDWICPIERFQSLEDAFAGTGRLTVEQVPGTDHSVLTDDRPPQDRVPLVRKFLHDCLD